jgi:hypothetical protein
MIEDITRENENGASLKYSNRAKKILTQLDNRCLEFQIKIKINTIEWQ